MACFDALLTLSLYMISFFMIIVYVWLKMFDET